MIADAIYLFWMFIRRRNYKIMCVFRRLTHHHSSQLREVLAIPTFPQHMQAGSFDAIYCEDFEIYDNQ